MTSRRTRTSHVRPRPPSTGRPAPTKRPTTRSPSPTRLAPHRKIERGASMPIYLRILMALVVVALGGVIVFAGIGLLGRVVAVISTSFSDAISQVTSSPSPSPSELIAPNAPSLSVPTEAYTNQKTVDLTGTIPAAYVGQDGITVVIYRQLANAAPQKVAEIQVGATAGFTAPGLQLGVGRNDFTATLVGPGGESPPSKAVTYILDQAKPKISITKPAKDAVVNGKTVTIAGKTQPRSTMVARNEANNASVTGTAGDDGAFSLVLAIAPGPNGIRITATDPAGNQGVVVINVNRGAGKLKADITASRYRFYRKQLPDDLTLTVVVTDPDGRPVDGATVTFTLTPKGVAPIVKTITTDGTGKAVWRTTIPRGAAVGRGIAAALVHTQRFGDATGQTFITVDR